MAQDVSPFFNPGSVSASGALAILHLKRDHLVPTVLDQDFGAGKVTNTRFGSFPHSTLVGKPWGTQVLASKVVGGRAKKAGKKRKREDEEESDLPLASSGFVYLLPPTPETWTQALPHRTQVVYTPDYSYILQKLRVRPGDCLIEAGAGSGSFTHAAARAVFSGYPGSKQQLVGGQLERRRIGKVYSFEFHKPRAESLRQELKEHKLDSIVEVTHRDVYQDGFGIEREANEQGDSASEPRADAIFLDLPAPWLALTHLNRSAPTEQVVKSIISNSPRVSASATPSLSGPYLSPLNPRSPVRICTFSPCIEQVNRTVSAMRSLGWVEIEMAEVAHKRLEIRRERIGLQEEGLRGANPSAATVDEAMGRLRAVEERAKAWQEANTRNNEGAETGKKRGKKAQVVEAQTKQQRLEIIRAAAEGRSLFKEGRLYHKTEPDLKTHTSYLVFAVLPRVWTEEDEQRCRAKWPSTEKE